VARRGRGAPGGEDEGGWERAGRKGVVAGRPTVVPTNAGAPVWVGNEFLTLKACGRATGGVYALLEVATLPRGGPPPSPSAAGAASAGLHSQDTAELFFHDVRVPVDNRLGEEGTGFTSLVTNLPQERLSIAAAGVAGARAALDWTIEYCRERQAFGQHAGRLGHQREDAQAGQLSGKVDGEVAAGQVACSKQQHHGAVSGAAGGPIQVRLDGPARVGQRILLSTRRRRDQGEWVNGRGWKYGGQQQERLHRHPGGVPQRQRGHQRRQHEEHRQSPPPSRHSRKS